jgi:hypothetical protein
MHRLLLGSALLVLTAVFVCGQLGSSSGGFNVTFTSKAPFTVGESTLPPGTYHIRMVDVDADLFECAEISGKQSVTFEAESSWDTPTATAVTFAKYNENLFLKSMSMGGVAGFWIPISDSEKETKKGGAKREKVSLAATNK